MEDLRALGMALVLAAMAIGFAAIGYTDLKAAPLASIFGIMGVGIMGLGIFVEAPEKRRTIAAVGLAVMALALGLLITANMDLFKSEG